MENKKISFGFSKIKKKPDVFITPKSNEKPAVQLIECLEGQSIKIKDHVEEEKKPLVIPIRSTRTAADIVRLARERRLQQATTTAQPQNEERPDSELSIDELAARELIREAQNRGTSVTNGAPKVTELPLKPDDIKLEGAIEPTNDDYEHVPISDYGKAMLRGMGWNEGMAIGKDPSKTVTKYDPELRPKGLGLGANKLVNAEKPKPGVDKNGKELVLKKECFAKVIAGANKGNYCQVQGFDDDTSRIIVRTAIGGKVLALNEFLLVPVTREEYSLGSKVINNAKYEEYKEISDAKLKRERTSPEVKRERSRSRSRGDRKIKQEKDESSDSEENERHRRKSKKSHKRKKSKKSKSRRRSSSASPAEDGSSKTRRDKKHKHKHNRK